MRKLAEGLEELRTAEGTPLPQNTLSELRRHLARLPMVGLIARVLGVGVETADMLVNEIFLRHWRESQSRRPLRRPYWLARRERQPSTS